MSTKINKLKMRFLFLFLLILALFLCSVKTISAAETAVRVVETNTSFSTLQEAVDAANISEGPNTIEVFGNTVETGNLVITSDITIFGIEGNQTVDLSSYGILVQSGKLTLGNGIADNTITFISNDDIVSVTGGEIYIHDGINLISERHDALILIGSTASGIIDGGYLKGNHNALSLKGGAIINKISGGEFTAAQATIHLTDLGTKINQISGGNFYQTDPDIGLHGHSVFLQNDSQIGEISGGYFEAAANTALAIVRGGWVETISGGEFVVLNPSGTTNINKRGIQITSEGTYQTGIGTISGGTIKGGYFGIFLQMNKSQINEIKGGTITGLIALQNDTGANIDEISGGTFSGNSQGIMNNGTIKRISGAKIAGNSYYGIFNYDAGIINEISGGDINGGDNGIANKGIIRKISGGIIVGENSAVSSSGAISGPQKIEVISGGVFWGKNNVAIKISSVIVLEPDLTTEEKGFARFWGANGIIFNNESFVNYPVNTELNSAYYMSTRTENVTGVIDVKFKYLTVGVEKPLYTITYNGNGNTGGTAPVDVNGSYYEDSLVTVLNQGSLVKTNYTFQGWSLVTDGEKVYDPGDDFHISGNTILYALWKLDDIQPAKIILTGIKTAVGKALVDGQFHFMVSEGDTVVATGTNTADGMIYFSEISYTEAGRHIYTVTESPVSGTGWEIDKTKYTVIVTVVDDGDGILVATADYPENGIKFINTYTPALPGSNTPQTAEKSTIELWYLISGLSLVVIFTLGVRKKYLNTQ